MNRVNYQEALINKIHEAINEIEEGKWADKSDEFGITILDIFRQNATCYLNQSACYLQNPFFVVAIKDLLKAMNKLEKTSQILKATHRINNIWENPGGLVPGSAGDLKPLFAMKKIEHATGNGQE